MLYLNKTKSLKGRNLGESVGEVSLEDMPCACCLGWQETREQEEAGRREMEPAIMLSKFYPLREREERRLVLIPVISFTRVFSMFGFVSCLWSRHTQRLAHARE